MRNKSQSRPITHRIAVSTEGEPTGVMDFLAGLREGLPGDQYSILPLPGGPENSLHNLGARGLSGMIGRFAGEAWRPPGLAAVNLEFLSHVPGIPSVSPDWQAAGKAAAEHLTDAGLARLSFVGVRGQLASRALFEGVFHQAETSGLSVREAPTLPLAQSEWLRTLETPCGLFCVSPSAAARLALVVQDAGLRIPEDLALLTIGDAALASLQAGLELSTLPLPHHTMGQAAAELMRRQIENPKATPESIRVAVAPVSIHASTLRRPNRRAAFERLLEALPMELDRAVSVEALAERAGMSRRAFEVAFRERTGRSPAVHLRALRLDAAKALLRKTTLPVAEVGRRCGYPEPHVFSATFKRDVGQSPLDWRRAVR